jgi:HlyD family secretion protein
MDAVAGDVPASSRDQLRASAVGLGHQVDAVLASSAVAAGQADAAARAERASTAQVDAAVANVEAVRAAVERARLLAAECEVRAPRDAVVEELPFEAGELVAPGAVLVRLVDLTEVTATFYLPNAELGVARPGAPAVVVADAWPGDRFRGTVATVGARAEFTPRNIQTRTDRDRLVYPIEVRIPNPDRRLRPGMPVQVTLTNGGDAATATASASAR